MKQTLLIAQIAITILLIGGIVLQNKSEGIGHAIGTEAAAFSTRRGVEKLLYAGTIVLIVVFLVLCVLNFVI
jgi:protein translocase SecG subunit